MIIALVLIAIALIIAVVIAFSLGLVKVEKVEVDKVDKSFSAPDPESAPDAEEETPSIDLDDGVSLKEKMALSGTLSGKTEKADPADETQDAEADIDTDAGQHDRLSNFKAGRRYLADCQRALAEAKANGALYTAAYFDFDRFRFLNSLKGMSTGDFALTRFSQDLAEVFPESSMITRVSADHFTAVFPVSDLDMFTICGEKLRDACEKLRVDMGVKSGLRACMGIALTDNVDTDYEIQVLIHKANVARHCIKTSRSETWKTFEDTMISTYLYGESALEDYSENQYDDEFVIYYSPIQELSMRSVNGVEALVRWACEDASGAPLPDKSRIPTNFTKIVFQVCKAMSRWRKAGKHVPPVHVNIPIIDLYKQDLDEFIARCLTEFQLSPSELVIVIQSSIIRTDWSAASRQIKKLRDIGVLVGVDDIDIGYSTLEFLSGLQLDFVKFHRSFAADMLRNENRQSQARSLISAAQGMRAKSIFEGVDSQERASLLEDLSVSGIQGRVCGKPLQADAFCQTLSDHVERRASKDTVILDDETLRKKATNP